MLDDEDYMRLYNILDSYGVKHTIGGLIAVLQEYADEMHDLGVKEKSLQAADMADALCDLLE